MPIRVCRQGFLWGGHLFLTGRNMDVISFKSRTLYPEDLEYAIEKQVTDVLRPGCASAFAYVYVRTCSCLATTGSMQRQA
jgi:acyl-CoA synthetase (AMP-forming)/AMP-acid ligase II